MKEANRIEKKNGRSGRLQSNGSPLFASRVSLVERQTRACSYAERRKECGIIFMFSLLLCHGVSPSMYVRTGNRDGYFELCTLRDSFLG